MDKTPDRLGAMVGGSQADPKGGRWRHGLIEEQPGRVGPAGEPTNWACCSVSLRREVVDFRSGVQERMGRMDPQGGEAN